MQAINERIIDGWDIVITGTTKPDLERYRQQARMLLRKEHLEWVNLDRKAIAEIRSSIASAIQVRLGGADGCDSAVMCLRYLSRMYGSSTAHRYGYAPLDKYLLRFPVFEPDMGEQFGLVQTELNRLNNLRRVDFRSFAELVDTIHCGRDTLTELGKSLDDVDATLMLINALGTPFAAFFHQFREVAVGRIDFKHVASLAQEEEEKMFAGALTTKKTVVARPKAIVVLKAPCEQCGPQASHSADRCWILHPELKSLKK